MASIEVFCCYAHQDAPYLENLKAHLTLLQRQGLIALWADTNISPGSNWEKEIEKHLNTAHLILLLISSDFMASDYCYSREMLRAIERHDRGEAIVIPVILRPVYWQGAPFARLQALPRGARPAISSNWHSLDEALLDVVNGIGEAIKFIQSTSSVKQNQLREYISQEVRKGRPISEVLAECDPNLDTLFQTIIEAANGRISEVIRMGKPTSKAFKDCSPGLENLFEVAISTYASGSSVEILQAQIEKMLAEISGVGEGDLRVQAEVIPDALGVLADTINYIIERLVSLIIRVQVTTAEVTKRTSWLLEDMEVQKGVIEWIANETASRSEDITFTTQMKRLNRTTARDTDTTEEIKRVMDKLYDSVSGFRLPQRIPPDM